MSEVFNGEPSLLDSIALKLDSAKRPVGNWRSLAGKLISSGQMFEEFDAQLHSSENPTSLLFRYLQTSESFNKLTVGDLKKYMQDMKRMDVLAALAGVKGLYVSRCTCTTTTTIFICTFFPYKILQKNIKNKVRVLVAAWNNHRG